MAAWNRLSTRQNVAAAIGVSAGATILYICYAEYRRRRGLVNPGRAEDGCEVRMKIHQHAANLLQEEDGSLNIRLINRIQTSIEVSKVPDSNGDWELTIRGNPSKVQQAQELISGILQGHIDLQVELHLPAKSMCKIIGQGGDQIREIRKNSGAVIECERKLENGGPTRCITITGRRKEVETAKTLIKKVMEEDGSILKRADNAPTFRSHRKEIVGVKKKDLHTPTEESLSPASERSPDSFHTANSPEKNMTDMVTCGRFVVPSPDFNFRAGEFVDVYVSVSENPEHFWIQILGSRFSQLAKLTTEMTKFYQRKEQKPIEEIQVGDIVAAPYHGDHLWYRAQVLDFLENGKLDLYYVDYGDNWESSKENLFPLRSDFLSLPFQAVEFGLANILPKGGTWSEEAVDMFDALSHCSRSKPLLAKISSFPSPGVSYFQVQLYDPTRQPMLDIGQELIRRGFAMERQPSPQKADDDTLVSRLLEEVMSLSRKSEPPSCTSRQEQEPFQGSNGSIEVVQADVDGSADHLVISPPSTPHCLELLEEVNILEESMSKLCLSNSEPSTPTTTDSPSKISTTTTDSSSNTTNTTDSSSQSTSSISRETSSCSSSSSSTSTTSEGQSFLSSSLEDSSIYSPRGCFYYLTDEISDSSILSSSFIEVITISSDSEGETEKPRPGPRKALATSGVLTSTPSAEVIVVEDDS